jgi:hypothetical protein
VVLTYSSVNRLSTILAGALVAFTPLRATTIVALWSPEGLSLAADSRVVTNFPSTSVSACKITHEGSTFFALSGLVQDDSVQLDANRVARAAVREAVPIEAKINRFADAMRPDLARAVSTLEKESPADFAFLKAGHPILQAVFADVQAGAPALAIVGFQLDPSGGLHEQKAVVADGSDNLGPRIIYAGQQGKIREYLRGHRDWFTSDREALLRNLVELEIAENTGRVGAPVDIVTITGAGVHWVQKKSQCSE